MARLARLMARRLALSNSEVAQLVLAATLHDIGKAAVPDAILTRPRPLNEHEWALVRAHADEGAAMLGPLALPDVAAVVRQHHERLDGSGYPQGLRGEQISVPARIVAVADSIDAMTATRPYSAARSLDDALGEVERLRGTSFWPEAVDAAHAVAALWLIVDDD